VTGGNSAAIAEEGGTQLAAARDRCSLLSFPLSLLKGKTKATVILSLRASNEGLL